MLLLLTMTAAQVAVSEDCHASWTKDPRPPIKHSRKCAEAWLKATYGPRFTVEDLSLDAPLGTKELVGLNAQQLRTMAGHVKKTCPKCTVSECADHDRACYIASRAVELFEGEAHLRVSIYDPVRMQSIGPLLWKVLAGQPLENEELEPSDGLRWTPLTLRKLRNAVFARHGRKFANPDLNALFYGPHPKDRKLPKLAINPDYADTLLTEIDKSNVRRIRQAERRLGTNPSNH